MIRRMPRDESKKGLVEKGLSEGLSNADIHRKYKVSRPTIAKWKKELEDEKGGKYVTKGRKRPEAKTIIEKIQYNHNKYFYDIQDKCGYSIKELIVLAKDPFYMTDGNVRKAITMTMIWIKEGWKKKYREWVRSGKSNDDEIKQKLLVHPRALHYQIDKRYNIEKKINGVYQSILYDIQYEFCWGYCQKGLKFARQIGFIPNDAIKDKKNPDPKNVPHYYKYREYEIPDDFKCPSDYTRKEKYNHYLRKFESYYSFDSTDVDKAIEDVAEDITDSLTERMSHNYNTAQPLQLELWCEKSEIIPYSIAKKFNIVIRECGGGEASNFMCYDAVMRAKKANKDVHVFYLVDFDPAGENMPVSAGRKIEYYARILGINAFLIPIALTYEQIIKYNLPSRPPEEGEKQKYGKGYQTIYEDFERRWGIKPVEINAFHALRPDEFKQEIEDVITPYYDNELEDKIEEAEDELKDEMTEAIKDELEKNKDDMENERKHIKDNIDRIEKYNDIEENGYNIRDTLTDKYEKRYKKQDKNISDNYDKVIEEYTERRDDLLDAIEKNKDKKTDPYENRYDIICKLMEILRAKRGYKNRKDVKTYDKLFDMDLNELLKNIEFEMPEADIPTGEGALLNTDRGYMEQLESYRQYKKQGFQNVDREPNGDVNP